MSSPPPELVDPSTAGAKVGLGLGLCDEDGEADGDGVGELVGPELAGEVVGPEVVGSEVVGEGAGESVGASVGGVVGNGIGGAVGAVVGNEVVGPIVGALEVGSLVGLLVGEWVPPEQELLRSYDRPVITCPGMVGVPLPRDVALPQAEIDTASSRLAPILIPRRVGCVPGSTVGPKGPPKCVFSICVVFY